MIKSLSEGIPLYLFKCTLLMIIACNGTFGTPAFAQPKLSLNEIKVELNGSFMIEEIFDIIETQTELSFSYHRNDISNSLRRVMDFSSQPNISIHSILTKLSEQEKLTFKRIDNTINVLKDNTLETPVVEEEIQPIE